MHAGKINLGNALSINQAASSRCRHLYCLAIIEVDTVQNYWESVQWQLSSCNTSWFYARQ